MNAPPMRVSVAAAAALLSLAAAPVSVQAAPERQRSTYWGQIALGAAGAADSGFYAASVGVGVQRRRLLLMGRVGSIGTEKRKRMEEAGVLVGLATRPAVVHLGGAAGLGVADDKRGNSALALPIEAQATWRPTPWFGLGARLFANVNRVTNFGGVTVAFQFGRLRP